MRAGPPPRTQQITSIVMMVLLLVMIVVMKNRCGEGTANLFKAMDQPVVDAGMAGVDGR